MNIYPQDDYGISYSISNTRVAKKHISYLKKKYVTGIIGVKNLPEDFRSINKDRGQEMVMQFEGKFVSDLYFHQRIFTKTNLSFIGNQTSFYFVNNKEYFRNSIDLIPFTYTKQYLSIPENYYRYQGITVTVYKRLFPIKLGFFGSKLSTRGLRYIRYQK